MGEIDTTGLNDLWNVLEQSSCFLITSNESYRMLLAALDLGWQVEEPVYLRPQWDQNDRWVFHFILKQNSMSAPRLITTRQSPDIERLVIEQGWQLENNYLHDTNKV
jgi:hypothetical protein